MFVVMPMLWFWLASDARPFRALYSGSGRLNLEFDVTKHIILGWVLLVDKDKLQRGYLSQECASD